ncbi:hypothetical protein N656DRAFT_166940 [Canariomyces notabilis]|uniref:Uncharacterized protein n=1 Tax=Canariomyces notabilis TaxID=2074819 RepID=A0AAN6QIU7_9PEZI|nr:hypothetical protein N656DRAFT_166940 [Canariomyces arenarius]
MVLMTATIYPPAVCANADSLLRCAETHPSSSLPRNHSHSPMSFALRMPASSGTVERTRLDRDWSAASDYTQMGLRWVEHGGVSVVMGSCGGSATDDGVRCKCSIAGTCLVAAMFGPADKAERGSETRAIQAGIALLGLRHGFELTCLSVTSGIGSPPWTETSVDIVTNMAFQKMPNPGTMTQCLRLPPATLCLSVQDQLNARPQPRGLLIDWQKAMWLHLLRERICSRERNSRCAVQ